MGRHQENKSRMFYEYDKTTDRSACTIAGCKRKIRGNHAGNLQRHLMACHKEKYEEVFTDSSTMKQPPDKKRCLQQSTPNNNLVRHEMQIPKELTNDALLAACTELVTVNGRPFSIFSDSGFKKIIDLIAHGLGSKVTITPSNIKTYITQVATRWRSTVKQEMQDRLLSLKVDCATKSDMSVLGINVQYLDKNEIIMHSLAIKELKGKVSSSSIAIIIMDILKNFDIDLKQIFSVTTDDGTNMLKGVKLLGEKQCDFEKNWSNNDDPEEKEDPPSKKELPFDEISADESKDIFLSNLDDSILKIIREFSSSPIIRRVKCAASILHLAVDDALKERNIAMIIFKARNVCKKLMADNVSSIIKHMKLPKPIIDCATCWLSTYEMLERLLHLQTFCKDMSGSIEDLEMEENDWTMLEIIIDCLKPAKKTTKLFQSHQLLAGDFYSAWYKCKADSAKASKNFGKHFSISMDNREKQLFEEDVILAVIFLDPRFKVILDENQIEKAKKYIMHAYNILQSIKQATSTIHFGVELICESFETTEDDNDIESFLRRKESSHNISTSTLVRKDIRSLLDLYQEEPRERRDSSLFEYWNRKEVSMPNLSEIAKSILSMPMTQVSVDRAFSALKYIQKTRSSVNEDFMEDVLLIRFNNILK